MILFIIAAICILVATIFADDWLIYHIKRDVKKTRPVWEMFKTVLWWLFYNVCFQIVNFFLVGLLSICLFAGLTFVCPSEKSQWEFKVNALQDNLVTEGTFYGRRGYVDGELSYFYSRTFDNGEKIGHIPADKTYVQYSEDEHPHVEVHNTQFDIPEWLTKVFFLDWINQKRTEYYILVVPEGTITTMGEYEIDMK